MKQETESRLFFSCEGERRFSTFNYVDLSSVCHAFLAQTEETDFVQYYFQNQYAWNFFPEGILFCALSEEDVSAVEHLVKNIRVVRFACGHAIHIEKKREFLDAVLP